VSTKAAGGAKRSTSQRFAVGPGQADRTHWQPRHLDTRGMHFIDERHDVASRNPNLIEAETRLCILP